MASLPRRPFYLVFLLLLVILLIYPWQGPSEAAGPWPLLAAELGKLGAEEFSFSGWILFGEDIPEGLACRLAGRPEFAGAAVSLQTAPGPGGFNLLSFRCGGWSFCPGLMGEAERLLSGDGVLKGWAAEALFAGGPADAPRLAGLLAEALGAEVHSLYREDGHVNLIGYAPGLPPGFYMEGVPVNLNLDLRYDRYRKCLRLRVGVPVLMSPLTPSPTL